MLDWLVSTHPSISVSLDFRNFILTIWKGWRKINKSISQLPIDLKRITRCKLALIFTSADHRKFLGLFGSEQAARISTSNEATIEGYAIKHVSNHCDTIMKNVINKKTKTKRQWLVNDLLLLFIKNMLQYLYILN